MSKTLVTNIQVASLANALSDERDAAVQFLVYGARDVDEVSLKAAFVSTDRQLAGVRSQSAWPPYRPGDSPHVVDVETFTAALNRVRNRTLTAARAPEVNVTMTSLFSFYVDVNEFLLVSVAKTNQVLE